MLITSNRNEDFYDESDSQLSSNPGDYRIVIGNQSAKITSSMIDDLIDPLINSYNQTKGSQSASIPIKGKIVSGSGIYYYDGIKSAGSEIPLYSKATILVKIGEGYIYDGKRVYVSSGEVVSAYRSYMDVAIFYWPEMKFAGWHRVLGEDIPLRGQAGGGDIYWKDVTTKDIEAWVSTLPVEN
ncbi:MAG: hypothetical protein FJ150_03535 [Euryarchaeota archaeon]|nr:hypothetical protein [Euryarchaeota archaeon]